MDETLWQLVEWLRVVSPLVWDTMLRQVRVQAAWYGIVALVAWAFAVGFMQVMRDCKRRWNAEMAQKGQSDYDSGMVGAGLCAVLLAFCALFLTLSGIVRLLNPAYYAIQTLMQLLLEGR